MSKQLAKEKLELGRARKVLWEYRNKDIEEFEFIDAMRYLEDQKLRIVKSHIRGLEEGVRAGSEEYKRIYLRALSDISGLINQEFKKGQP